MKKSNTTRLTDETIKQVIKKDVSKSKRIIELFDGGLTVKEISVLLDIRYNFSYNVIQNYIVQNDIEVSKEQGSSKKQQIIELFKGGTGRSVKEISKELKTPINYVYKVINEERSSKKQAAK